MIYEWFYSNQSQVPVGNDLWVYDLWVKVTCKKISAQIQIKQLVAQVSMFTDPGQSMSRLVQSFTTKHLHKWQ